MADFPEPTDFIANYTRGHDAALELWVVDERPPAALSPRGIVRRIRQILRGDGQGLRDNNDSEAERDWAAMKTGWGQTTPQQFETYLRSKFDHDLQRRFEYPFQVRCLTAPGVCVGVVVDMGGGNSYSTVVPIVLGLRDSRTISVDVVNHTAVSKYGIEYVRGDCMNTTLPAECADVVTIISTLEHVGLGRWGDPLDVDGDIKAMREARRILRPGGHVVLTVPYGYPTVVFNLHRIYDQGRINKLSEGFEMVREEYTLDGAIAARDDIEGQKIRPGIPSSTRRKLPDASAPQVAGGGMFFLRKTN